MWMYVCIALLVGAWNEKRHFRQKIKRLEEFMLDPEVQSELMKCIEAHAARDKVRPFTRSHRQLEKRLLGDPPKFTSWSEEGRKLIAPHQAEWDASEARDSAAQDAYFHTNKAWHDYTERMDRLVARHGVDWTLRYRLIRHCDPQIFSSE
jgi:hypothetical protein